MINEGPMKKFLSLLLFLSLSTFAQEYNYLKPEDQKYYKNEAQDGQNKMERIDDTVREINRLHGMIAELKSEVTKLKNDVEELKKKK